jgi:hypothetical protein
MLQARLRFSWFVSAVSLFCVTSASGASPRLLSGSVEPVSDGDTVISHLDNGTRLRVPLLGLGEADPEELRSSIIGPQTRRE